MGKLRKNLSYPNTLTPTPEPLLLVTHKGFYHYSSSPGRPWNCCSKSIRMLGARIGKPTWISNCCSEFEADTKFWHFTSVMKLLLYPTIPVKQIQQNYSPWKWTTDLSITIQVQRQTLIYFTAIILIFNILDLLLKTTFHTTLSQTWGHYPLNFFSLVYRDLFTCFPPCSCSQLNGYAFTLFIHSTFIFLFPLIKQQMYKPWSKIFGTNFQY